MIDLDETKSSETEKLFIEKIMTLIYDLWIASATRHSPHQPPNNLIDLDLCSLVVKISI